MASNRLVASSRGVAAAGRAALCLCLVFGARVVGAKDIMSGSRLAPGYDLGISTSHGQVGWIHDEGGSIRVEYPGNQQWGAVFVTVGPARVPPWPSEDFSEFSLLRIDVKGRT